MASFLAHRNSDDLVVLGELLEAVSFLVFGSCGIGAGTLVVARNGAR
jgi:hypothetical protein